MAARRALIDQAAIRMYATDVKPSFFFLFFFLFFVRYRHPVRPMDYKYLGVKKKKKKKTTIKKKKKIVSIAALNMFKKKKSENVNSLWKNFLYSPV